MGVEKIRSFVASKLMGFINEKNTPSKLTAIIFLLAAYNRGITKTRTLVVSSVVGYIRQKENSASKL